MTNFVSKIFDERILTETMNDTEYVRPCKMVLGVHGGQTWSLPLYV